MSATFAEIERAREQYELLQKQLAVLTGDSSLDALKVGQIVQRLPGNDIRGYLVVDEIYPRSEPTKAEIYFYFESIPGKVIVQFSKERPSLSVERGILVIDSLSRSRGRSFTPQNGFEFSSRQNYLERLGIWRGPNREDPYAS